MAASFDPDMPLVRDRIRAVLGDMGVPIPSASGRVDVEGALRGDGFYDSALNEYADWRLAGAFVARSLASQFAQRADSVSISGEVSVSWRSRVSNWAEQAKAWEEAVASGGDGSAVGYTTTQFVRPDDRGYGEFRRRDPGYWQQDA